MLKTFKRHAAGIALAGIVVAAVAIVTILIIPATSPAERAALERWESLQTPQEGHGAIKDDGVDQ